MSAGPEGRITRWKDRPSNKNPTSIPLFFPSRYFNPVPIDRPSRSIQRMRISRYDGGSRGGLINE
ncbi:hypothetical protein ALC56_06049 [Trachymyrmex septentrionalis]|uniref:Uncharacterized protein n=1 Tax=Trachymyrmex septentrionalis TaxID=34720 RepID=A0A195FFS6_9HYME|nr:hypothetical protein ALC56_06049 [Trachymyrmex septentrionalis]